MELELNERALQTLIAEGKPLMVDCWAPWCGPCKMMLPVVDELAAEYEGRVQIGKLNADENMEACSQWQVMSIPTFLFFKGGKLVDRTVGAMRKQDLAAKLDSLL
jgi:thioredoxin 1